MVSLTEEQVKKIETELKKGGREVVVKVEKREVVLLSVKKTKI